MGVRVGAVFYVACLLAACLHALIAAGRWRARGLLTRSAAGTPPTSSTSAATASASTKVVVSTLLQLVGFVLVIKAEQEGVLFRAFLELEHASIGVGVVF